MRTRTLHSLILVLLSIAALPAQAGEKHLLLGTWSVDVSKLEPANRPTSVTLQFLEASNDSYLLSVDIVAANGRPVHGGSTIFKPDGTVIAIPNSPEADVATFSMPNRKTLVMAGSLGGHPSHTRIWTLADDGKSMTETIVGHIDGKTPHIRTATWTRIKRTY